jgi:hypothetical protein
MILTQVGIVRHQGHSDVGTMLHTPICEGVPPSSSLMLPSSVDGRLRTETRCASSANLELLQSKHQVRNRSSSSLGDTTDTVEPMIRCAVSIERAHAVSEPHRYAGLLGTQKRHNGCNTYRVGAIGVLLVG